MFNRIMLGCVGILVGSTINYSGIGFIVGFLLGSETIIQRYGAFEALTAFFVVLSICGAFFQEIGLVFGAVLLMFYTVTIKLETFIDWLNYFNLVSIRKNNTKEQQKRKNDTSSDYDKNVYDRTDQKKSGNKYANKDDTRTKRNKVGTDIGSATAAIMGELAYDFLLPTTNTDVKNARRALKNLPGQSTIRQRIGLFKTGASGKGKLKPPVRFLQKRAPSEDVVDAFAALCSYTYAHEQGMTSNSFDLLKQIGETLSLSSEVIEYAIKAGCASTREAKEFKYWRNHARSCLNTNGNTHNKKNYNKYRNKRSTVTAQKTKSPYTILGVSQKATKKKVKKAYRKKVKKHHPDQYSQDEKIKKAEEKMATINQAYQRIQQQKGWA